MTDKEALTLLRKAKAELMQTTQGYTPAGMHWRAAFAYLDDVAKHLSPPAIGPIWAGGKSVLLHDLTHATSGIPLYPAFDDAFVAGTSIIAPEPLTVFKRRTSANPGKAFFARGTVLDYWFGHLDRDHPLGTTFRKGQLIGKVAANATGGGPHVHCGVNVERLWGAGKQLEHRTDYRHGAPTVGVQLARHDL